MTAAQFRPQRADRSRPGWPPRTSDLLLPGTIYGDRINAVDMRFAKVLRFGKTKTNMGLDVYNLFNSNTATTYETVYDPRRTGRNGCSRRPCCCRGSCGSTCSSTSDRARGAVKNY